MRAAGGPGTRVVWAMVMALAACAGSDEGVRAGAPAAGTADADTADAGTAGGTMHEYAYLEPHVERLLSFLVGGEAPPAGMFADSVTLLVAPEGGGATAVLTPTELADRAAWRVDDHALTPPAGYAHRQVAPGRHWNCQATDLSTLYPDLASLPHVGVRLSAEADASCMQTWNATFVFDQDAARPRLIAVVYDQWEW